jgi:ferric-dicitrate binding protein FerR (iron transport regulator)
MSRSLSKRQQLQILAGDVCLEDPDAVRRLQSLSPEDAAYLRDVAEIRRIARAVDGSIEVGGPPPIGSLVRIAEMQQIARNQTARTTRHARIREWRAPLVAAAAVIVVALAALRMLLVPASGTGQLYVDTFVTGPTEAMTMRLSDGSVVRLGAGSQLRIHAARGMRVVDLDGRAFFSIQHDPETPFIVRTRVGDARVLGTRFQAETGEGSLSVVVFEGRVALSDMTQETQITAFQLGRIVNGRMLPTVEVPDLVPVAEWMGDFVAFQATPLPAAVRELAARYSMRYEIAASAPTDRNLTMWFVDRTVDEMIDVMCAVLGITCSVEQDLIRIGR